jgi:stearoyl-CoA desaturase (delta-9 desaturase)
MAQVIEHKATSPHVERKGTPPHLERTASARLESEPAPQRVQGTLVLEDKEVRLQRRIVLIVTLLPFLGFVGALVTMWGWGISLTDFTIFLGFYLFTGFGLTVGYHRLFTHRSFEAGPRTRALFAFAGSMAVEGSVIPWVANHRRHHAYADKDGDPHSPHLDEGAGIMGVLKGLWHAHLGWLFDAEKTEVERWAPDLLKEARIARISAGFPWIAVFSFVAPALLGLLVTQSLWGMATAFLWGSLARIFMLHHVTWSINSICHFYGKREFETTDCSTNNWALSIISFGESWHNNHHAFPTSAEHGLGRHQPDLSALVIKALARLKLARNVKTVSLKQLANKHAG